jgi:hypothetical protein
MLGRNFSCKKFARKWTRVVLKVGELAGLASYPQATTLSNNGTILAVRQTDCLNTNPGSPEEL